MSAGIVVFSTIIMIAVLVMVCAVIVYLERNFQSEKYDERQKIARGNAYRFSHWTGMIYYFGLLVYFVLHTGKGEWAVEPFVLLMIGILIQLQSFHIYCLITHSALPLGEKPLVMIVGYVILGGMYLAQYYFQYIPEEAAKAAGFTGVGSYNLMRLLIALDFLSLAALHLIACLRKEKD